MNRSGYQRVVMILGMLAVLAMACATIVEPLEDLAEISEQPPTVPEDASLPVPGTDSQEPPVAEQPGALDGAGPDAGYQELLMAGPVELFYDPGVILVIEAEAVAGAEGGMFTPYPDYGRYLLPVDDGTIEVVDVYNLAYVNPGSVAEIDNLKTRIENRNLNALWCIPEVPLADGLDMCNRQQFFSNAEFIDFKNGSGVRFVTVYAIQDSVPVTNEYLQYVFIGLTGNGDCYVKAKFAITHADIPSSGWIPDEVYSDSSGELMEEYFMDNTWLLESAPDGFFPELEYFDAIIESLAIGVCGAG